MRQSDRRLHYPDPLLQAFSETGESIFWRSTMRLGIPRIKSLQTDDATASITFLGVDTNPDTTGGVYLFRLKTPSGDIDGEGSGVRVDLVDAAPRWPWEGVLSLGGTT